MGQGTQDDEYHTELVKIAENVIHVDYSRKEFVIYLTADHKLYDMGTACTGAMQQQNDDIPIRTSYTYMYTVCEPILLMEDVIYARCGQGGQYGMNLGPGLSHCR